MVAKTSMPVPLFRRAGSRALALRLLDRVAARTRRHHPEAVVAARAGHEDVAVGAHHHRARALQLVSVAVARLVQQARDHALRSDLVEVEEAGPRDVDVALAIHCDPAG